jgi:hypothetical protein
MGIWRRRNTHVFFEIIISHLKPCQMINESKLNLQS